MFLGKALINLMQNMVACLPKMRAEYEKQARLKREQELENLVRSKGEFQINLDATQVFDPYDPPVFSGFGGPPKQAKRPSPLGALSRAQVQQLFMKHSFEVKLHFTRLFN